MEEQHAYRQGDVVTGVLHNTGKRVTGFYRLTARNGQHVVDGERWTGDPERMPHPQWMLNEIEPVEGEGAETLMYETAAKAILAGQSTRDAEVADIAKRTKASKAKVGEKLDGAIAEQKELARRADAPKRQASARPKGGRPSVEHVEPKAFADLRDGLGLTNKEAAAANAEAGLGSTLSRITELTHSKGASKAIFEKVEAAWTSYAASLKKTGAPR